MDDKKSVNKNKGESKKSVKKSPRTRKINLPSAEECAIWNRSLNDGRSSNASSGLSVITSVPSRRTRNNINQSDNNSFVFSRELRNRTNCSRNADALLSPRANPTASSTSILEHSETNQRGQVASLVPTILHETNFPSPEMKEDEMDAINGFSICNKGVTRNSSLKSASNNESYQSKIRLRSTVKNDNKSPTYLQTRETRSTAGRNEETVSHITSSITSKRKKKTVKRSSIASKTINDSYKLNLRSASSAANNVHKASTNLKMLESKIIDQNTEESESNTTSLQDQLPFNSSDSNSFAKHSDPESLHQTRSALNLSADKHESAMYLNALIAPSTSSNLDSGKLQDSQSASNASAKSVLPNFSSKEFETSFHPQTSADAYSSKASQQNKLIFLYEKRQPDIPDNEPLHHHSVSDSDLEPTSECGDSPIENSESFKMKKTNDSSLVSPEDTQSASNLSVRKINAPNSKPSFCAPVVLNPHLPLAASKIVDRGIETRKLNRSSELSPAILNPHFPSSCYLPLRRSPLRNNSPVVNVRHPVSKFDAREEKERIDQKLSYSSLALCTPNPEYGSQSQKYVSDEISASKTSPEGQTQYSHFNSPRRYQSKRESAPRSSLEIARDMSQTSRIVAPLFGRILPRPSLNMTLASKNKHEFQTESSRSNQSFQEIIETPSFDEESSARHAPETLMQQNCIDPLLQKRATKSILSEMLRNPLPMGNEHSPYIDVLEGEASTSKYQPLVKDCSCDDDSSSLLDEKPCEQTPPERIKSSVSSRAERFPEYAFEARVLLRSVLKEIMLFNGERDEWSKLAMLFNRFSESSAQMDQMSLYAELIWYLARRGYGLWHQNLVKPLATTVETYTLEAYETLTTIVVTILASTLTVQSGWSVDKLLLSYDSFRTLFGTFSQYWENADVDYIDDKESRNQLTNLKNMIQRHLLVTQTALQLLLIYIGENADEEEIKRYQKNLFDEDEKYLKRKS